MKDLIFGAMFLMLAIWCFVYSLSIDEPTAYWSVSENKCVGVVIDGERFDCSILTKDSKYEREWVK